MIPSGEVAATEVEVGPPAQAKKTLPFQAISCQATVEGSVLAVHVTPSGDVTATLEAEPPPTTEQKTEPLKAMPLNCLVVCVVAAKLKKSGRIPDNAG